MKKLYVVSQANGSFNSSRLLQNLGKFEKDVEDAARSALRELGRRIIRQARRNIRAHNAGTGYPQTGRLANSLKAQIVDSGNSLRLNVIANSDGSSPQAGAMNEPEGVLTPIYASTGNYMVFYWHRRISFAYSYKKRLIIRNFPGLARFDLTHIHGTGYLDNAFDYAVGDFEEVFFEELGKRA